MNSLLLLASMTLAAPFQLSNSRESALAMTLTAMNDGVDVGGQAVAVVDAKKLKLDFIPADVPNYPRTLGPLIARAAAELQFADMPDCAEKQYMIQSWETRAWIELGGEPAKLPVLEGLINHKDETVAARYSLWLAKGREMALYKISQATKTRIIPDLEDAAKTEDEKVKLKRANERFTKFLAEENEWRRAYQIE